MIQPPRVTRAPGTPLKELKLSAQRRAAIDQIVNARASAIRCGLFGSYLFRPNPLRDDSAEVRASWVDEMWQQYEVIARVAGLVQGRDPAGEFPPGICRWIAHTASHQTKQVADITRMQDLTKTLIEAVPTGGAIFEQLLIDHAVTGRKHYFPAVSTICDALWSALDQERHADAQRAQQTGEAISATLSRLEHIGRHVRLVSINASVESSRVGEAGKGLSVIAQEFKSLAEEIQHLAQTAREDIESISKAIS